MTCYYQFLKSFFWDLIEHTWVYVALDHSQVIQDFQNSFVFDAKQRVASTFQYIDFVSLKHVSDASFSDIIYVLTIALGT
jgi:hypothetical protein